MYSISQILFLSNLLYSVYILKFKSAKLFTQKNNTEMINHPIRSHETFSMASQFVQNQQNKKCDFCLYHEIIFQQLHRLKQAVLIKNKRIIDLEQFIKKISEMAFINQSLPLKSTNLQNESFSSNSNYPKNNNSLSQQQSLRQQQSLKQQQNRKSQRYYYQNRLQDQSQISFRNSKQNTGRFSQKASEIDSLSLKIQRVNELNQIKKQIQRKFINQTTSNHQSNNLKPQNASYLAQKTSNFQQKHSSFQQTNSHFQQKPSYFKQKQFRFPSTVKAEKKKYSLQSSKEYSTIRTQSEPQQQGPIGSIINISDELRLNNSLSDRIQEKQKKNKGITVSTKDDNKMSISMIKEYLKRIN